MDINIKLCACISVDKQTSSKYIYFCCREVRQRNINVYLWWFNKPVIFTCELINKKIQWM